ncbi:hypothetical protein PZA11_000756 [Diplocarpon coronariae]|nr:hypothetical protein JHW43_004609 [Diplocarpon mali]
MLHHATLVALLLSASLCGADELQAVSGQDNAKATLPATHALPTFEMPTEIPSSVVAAWSSKAAGLAGGLPTGAVPTAVPAEVLASWSSQAAGLAASFSTAMPTEAMASWASGIQAGVPSTRTPRATEAAALWASAASAAHEGLAPGIPASRSSGASAMGASMSADAEVAPRAMPTAKPTGDMSSWPAKASAIVAGLLNATLPNAGPTAPGKEAPSTRTRGPRPSGAKFGEFGNRV